MNQYKFFIYLSSLSAALVEIAQRNEVFVHKKQGKDVCEECYARDMLRVTCCEGCEAKRKQRPVARAPLPPQRTLSLIRKEPATHPRYACTHHRTAPATAHISDGNAVLNR